MERAEQIKCTVRVFTVLMRQLSPRFSFPKGGVAAKTVSSCLDSLEAAYSVGLSPERIVDYCVCQVYAASRYDKGYVTGKWNITHSFGKKALERFKETGKAKKYYEDKWLRECALSRSMLLSLIGAFVGLFLGIAMEGYVVITAEVDQVMFGREIHALSFVIAFALTMLFSVIVTLAMKFKLKKIDMVESLKSVD